MDLAKTVGKSPISPRMVADRRGRGNVVCGVMLLRTGDEARVSKCRWAANGPSRFFIFPFTFELPRFLNLCKWSFLWKKNFTEHLRIHSCIFRKIFTDFFKFFWIFWFIWIRFTKTARFAKPLHDGFSENRGFRPVFSGFSNRGPETPVTPPNPCFSSNLVPLQSIKKWYFK